MQRITIIFKLKSSRECSGTEDPTRRDGLAKLGLCYLRITWRMFVRKTGMRFTQFTYNRLTVRCRRF